MAEVTVARGGGGGSGATLEAADLALGFGARDRPLLADVALEARPDRALIVAGASGAGRTSLAQALTGLMPRLVGGWRSGTVRLSGADGVVRAIDEVSPARWLAAVGWVGSGARDGLTGARDCVHGEVAFALEQRGVAPEQIRTRVDAALEALHLGALAERDPLTLSDGEAARVALAGIAVAVPDVYVLDGPDVHLDASGRAALLALVAGSGAAVVVTTGLPAFLAEAAPAWLARADALVLAGGRVARRGAAAAVLGAPDLTAHGVAPALALALPREDRPTASAAPPRAMPSGLASSLPAPAPPPGGAWDLLSPRGAPCGVAVRELVVRLGGTTALDGVTLAFEPGTVTALVGANGGGKSTLLRAIAGLVAPAAGAVRLAGGDPRRLGAAARVQTVGWVGSRPEDRFVAAHVRSEIGRGPSWLGRAGRELASGIDAARAAAGLAAGRDDHPRDLPASQRRWLALATTLVLRPWVLALDEPTSDLDAAGLARFEDAVATWRSQGRTVVMATHDLDVAAEVADRVVVLVGGRVVADDAPAALLGRPGTLAAAGLAAPARMAVAARLGRPATGRGTRAALWSALAEAEERCDAP